jgi:hypothetical protein
MSFVFQTFFTEKNSKIFKAFSPLFNFLLSFSPQTGKLVKIFWVCHLVFWLKINRKQTRFFTKNSAEKANQCQLPDFVGNTGWEIQVFQHNLW